MKQNNKMETIFNRIGNATEGKSGVPCGTTMNK